MLDWPITSKLQITGGARIEYSKQEVNSFELYNPDLEPSTGSIETTDILPAGTAIYSLGQRTKLRLAASQTVSRPDFRELSEFVYIDYDGGYSVVGNPELERALIQNYDLRYEWVHGKANLFSASVFYKNFENPIELVRVPYSGKTIRPINAESAFNYGVEFEMRQALGELWWRLHPFSISTNLTLLKSEVEIDTSAALIATRPDRPLQGQSPYLLNANLNYTNEWTGTQVDLLFNVFGKRISEVGSDVLSDIYELPHPELDLTFRQPLSQKVTLKGSVENILNPEIRFEHDDEEYIDDQDYYTRKYRKGHSFSLGITYKP
jgi:TonB-dependent receptor